MDSINQGESSGGPSGQPTKKKRGRPPKDPSLKYAEAAHVVTDSRGRKECTADKSNREAGSECVIGQAVTGVTTDRFGDGYWVTVRIGNSNTDFRGIVFKEGHCGPITAENDVAPGLPMIGRNYAYFTTEDLGRSHGQGPAMQTDSVVPLRCKYARRKPSSSVPPVDAESSAVPAAHQSGLYPSKFPTFPNPGDEVHVVEPLSMVPPHESMEGCWITTVTQFHTKHQVTPGSGEQNDDDSMNDSTSEGKPKPVTPTNIDTPSASQISDGKVENDASVVKPLFNFGMATMTELLKAVQDNAKETGLQTSGQPSSATGVDYHETDQKDKAGQHNHNA